MNLEGEHVCGYPKVVVWENLLKQNDNEIKEINLLKPVDFFSHSGFMDILDKKR